MPRQSVGDYLIDYHFMVLDDDMMGLWGVADIQKYISGNAPPGNDGEEWAIRSIIAKAKGVSANQLPNKFIIKGDSRVLEGEVFYGRALRRAFQGRGSPSEIRDAVRLAFLTGRIKNPVAATDYARKWFGQDCNAFVGNYLGVSPDVAIFAYALGYGKGKLLGSSPDVEVARAYLPIPPVDEIRNIKSGTVVITYEPGAEKPWKHIALVSAITLKADGTGAQIILCEWGTAGNFDAHCSDVKNITFDFKFKITQLPGKKLIAFDGTSPSGAKAKRVFFDPANFSRFPPRTWGVGDEEGI